MLNGAWTCQCDVAWPASVINTTEQARASVRTPQGPVSETGDVVGAEEMLRFFSWVCNLMLHHFPGVN